METINLPCYLSISRIPSPSSSVRRRFERSPHLCLRRGAIAGGGVKSGGARRLSFQAKADNGNGATRVPDSSSNQSPMPVRSSGSLGMMRLEPYNGKSGSVSFCGLTYSALEERQLVSSPFNEGAGSFLWIAGPLALISSLVLPQFFVSGFIEALITDEILAETAISVVSEGSFYLGLAVFLRVVDRVQRPYLEFSAKRWSLITGLRGYFYSMFSTMGLKIFVPLLAAFAAWPAIGLPAAIAVAPFLTGCAAQFVFESVLSRRRSSCWPLVPVIFEVYRLYQLSRGAHFVQRMMFAIRGTISSGEFLEQRGAFMAIFVSFQVLGVVCLWSLTTFLLRLFPSRPVAENY
ncbi:tRNA-processing ribonuclease BN isoform X2 [Wolffia australiana]